MYCTANWDGEIALIDKRLPIIHNFAQISIYNKHDYGFYTGHHWS